MCYYMCFVNNSNCIYCMLVLGLWSCSSLFVAINMALLDDISVITLGIGRPRLAFPARFGCDFFRPTFFGSPNVFDAIKIRSMRFPKIIAFRWAHTYTGTEMSARTDLHEFNRLRRTDAVQCGTICLVYVCACLYAGQLNWMGLRTGGATVHVNKLNETNLNSMQTCSWFTRTKQQQQQHLQQQLHTHTQKRNSFSWRVFSSEIEW